MTDKLCTAMAMYEHQCFSRATWENQNGVKVCDYHKLVLDAFTWEGRNTRKWEQITEEVKP